MTGLTRGSTAIPDVDFDIGESYAGLLPISDAEDETRELFFWFFPTTNADPKDEIAIWFNGGPGCSSLSGLLTENGPFTWEAGTLQPVQNPYTWGTASIVAEHKTGPAMPLSVLVLDDY